MILSLYYSNVIISALESEFEIGEEVNDRWQK
jgi:hypothetical protein